MHSLLRIKVRGIHSGIGRAASGLIRRERSFLSEGTRTFSSSTKSKRLAALSQTNDWINRLVIGKGLCPWAAEPFVNGSLRIQIVEGGERGDYLLDSVKREIASLLSSDSKETTTLVVFPDSFERFGELKSFEYEILESIHKEGLFEEVQVVAFHPEGVHSLYSCEEMPTPYDYVTRAPYPTIHLLRTVDLVKANKQMGGDTEKVPTANVKKMEGMGIKAIEREWTFSGRERG